MKRRVDRRRPHVRLVNLPVLLCILLGLPFFGGYLLLARSRGEALPGRAATFFLLGYLLAAGMVYLFFLLAERRREEREVLEEALNVKLHRVFRYEVDLPYAIVSEKEEDVLVVNTALQRILGAPDPFFHGAMRDLCGVSIEEVAEATRSFRRIREFHPELVQKMTNAHETGESEYTVFQEGVRSEINRALDSDDRGTAADGADGKEDGLRVRLADGRLYLARTYPVALTKHTHYLVTFTDVTQLAALQEKIKRDMPVIAYLDVDNLEELTQYTRVSYRDASRQVGDILIQWAANLGGLLREYERDRYLLLFSQEKLKECEDESFSSLLDKVRGVRLGVYSIPVTISGGVSVSESPMAARAQEAASALDMALQRGGDQIAVRRQDGGIRYYGGQVRPFQRRTKVQSRVVADYLLSKISESDNLLVMGHSDPDFDSIGSCIGLAQLGLFAGVPTKIIVDTGSANFRVATERLTGSRLYNDMFITGDKGLDLIRPGTLLILSDVNNFRIVDTPDVAASVRQISGKIAIIDHHRQTGEYDFEPVLNYIDPSASSASELVTEILEQSENGHESTNTKLINDEIASIILSGIMLDTNGFTHNTGSRTLDAMRHLLDKGANIEYVGGFFKKNYADYVCERSFSECRLLHDNTVGLTWSRGTGRSTNDRVSAAREAEKLLSVKGVHAAFALVVIDNMVHISGRSDGSINVQLILERLGGGGRFDSAGAALKEVSLLDAVAQLQKAVGAYFTGVDNRF